MKTKNFKLGDDVIGGTLQINVTGMVIQIRPW